MIRIMILMTLFFIGATNNSQADEVDDARLANAIKNYEAEKQESTISSNPNMENQTEKDISSDSDVQTMERTLMTDPTNAKPEPQGGSYRPPS